MMKHLAIILITLCCFIDVQGQRLRAGALAGKGASAGIKITRNYDNVSMSEALRDLNELSPDYTISFMYNELEDFRVTTSIKHQSVPDALRQIIGFYPVRVVKRGAHELYAYCIHKTDRHLTGTIIDEQGQPVAYANVCLLHPSDSTLIGGGVSNEAGLFVIPYETPPQIGNGREGAKLLPQSGERLRVGDGTSGMVGRGLSSSESLTSAIRLFTGIVTALSSERYACSPTATG